MDDLKGFSLVELLIALIIVSVSMLWLLVLNQQALQQSNQQWQRLTAIQWLQNTAAQPASRTQAPLWLQINTRASSEHPVYQASWGALKHQQALNDCSGQRHAGMHCLQLGTTTWTNH
jgi:prepilin-type N-terminal cleavage/methylation domain-containing protein